MNRALLVSLFGIAFSFLAGSAFAVELSGPQVAWQTLTLNIEGPAAAETDNSPNPFLDYRLQVLFTSPGGQKFDVPGYFDGDGQGGAKGRIWRVRFTPNKPGTWTYDVRMHAGKQIAIDFDPQSGEPVKLTTGSGSFEVAPRDPQAEGFAKWGRLEYAGKHYLKFAEGPYWIRGGTDEPEDFLGYAGFDRTPPKHKYADHLSDWRAGDPDWGDGRGRAIIGAINYLAEQHVNSVYFLLMNVGGDGKDVWPWSGTINGKGSPDNDNLHYDVGKLGQWETVFAHAQRRGLFLHAVFNEAEAANKQELDNGELGPERKLYYREMIARFGHHLAMEWNLCEEYNLQFDLGAERVRAFADYVRAVDPYDHPITVHSAGDPVKELRFTFGDDRFSMTSIQLNQKPIHEVTEAFWRETKAAGRPLPVSLDEFTLDRGQRASHIPVDDAEGHRREKLWPTYFSGGMIEFILSDLLKTDSFKTPEREKLWQYVWHARKFMEQNLPFWEMEPTDGLSAGAATFPLPAGKGQTVPLAPQVFAKRGEVYAVYLAKATPSGTLDLSELKGPAEQRWYNPRTGEFVGQPTSLTGGGHHPLGPPPADPDQDWVVLIKKVGSKSAVRFPSRQWEVARAADVGLNAERLEEFARQIGGDGCIVRQGLLVKGWGQISKHKDWASAAKPVLSTLLLLAVQEGKLKSVDTPLKDLGWPMAEKDAAMTFRHLANMTSGYGRGEPPGAAWGYNDHAIELYAQSLVKAFGQPLDQVLRQKLAKLEFEDGEFFGSRRQVGVSASSRDFARLGWLWLNRGDWNGTQVLDRALFDENIRAQVPADLPRTSVEGDSYLKLGTYGGGTDQTPHGPGVYGFNFWFNATLPSGERVWPALPADAFQANGMWNRDTLTVIPSWQMVVAVRGAKGQKFTPGEPESEFNQLLGLLTPEAEGKNEPAAAQLPPIDVFGFRDGAHHWRKIRDDSRVIQAAENQAAYQPTQVREIAENILLFQRANGGWPKDYDMLAVLTDEQRAKLQATHDALDTSYDNHNIHSQVDYLARAYARDEVPAWREACLRGLDFILASQQPGGGFPQRWPQAKGFSIYVTFNDGVMIGNLNLLLDTAEAPHWQWLGAERRAKCAAAAQRGLACTLKCQIRVNGQPTGWCQQHDPVTYEAMPARTFELASGCPQETTDIARFLMRQNAPSPEIRSAIDSAVAWLRKTQLTGVRVERVKAPPEEFMRHKADFDTIVSADPKAPPIWARHYEIGTDRPVFAGRDGIKRYSLAEIERERRTGTPWYGGWPRDLLEKDYPEWRKKVGVGD